MSMRQLLRSFAGGEVTPELGGRVDHVKYMTGLATCRNFMVLPHGPVANRPGFEYVLEVKHSARRTRLIPFSYNNEQTFAIELGHRYARFHTMSGTLLEAGKRIGGITRAHPAVMTLANHGFMPGDWLYLSNLNGMTSLNGRWVKVAAAHNPDTCVLFDLADRSLDTRQDTPYGWGGLAARVVEVTTPWQEKDIFDVRYVQSADVLTLVHHNYPPAELRRLGATQWELHTIAFAPTLPAPKDLQVQAVLGRGDEKYRYVVTALAKHTQEESLPSESAEIKNNLTQQNAKNRLTWTAVKGSARYSIYRFDNGLYGFIGQTAEPTFIDNNIMPDISRTPPQGSTPFEGAGNYPRAVSYFEQRRCFASTINQPQSMWMSASATQSNFSYSIPTRDDDAITFRIAAREVNTIAHIVPLASLVLLTSSAEWQVTSLNSDAITPRSISVRPQGYVGASRVTPLVIGNSILYVQARGGRVREMGYQWQANGFVSQDASLLATHLFDRYTIEDLCYTRAPYQMVWAISSSGRLLGLTYVPEQEVGAWHKHDTLGAFESCTSVAEENEDALYVIVQREVEGRKVRYVERLHSRFFTSPAESFFVDSGITYRGEATSTLQGLHHLEGHTVNILGEGAVMPPQTVKSGAITLDRPVRLAHVGLPITADLKTLPLTLQTEALGQGCAKNIARITLRVHESSGIFAGPTFERLTEIKQRTTEPYGTPPAFKSAELPVVLPPAWGRDGAVCVRQCDPLPLTILSMTLEVGFGG